MGSLEERVGGQAGRQANQVSGKAGGCQIADAENMITFNVGGSATTCVSFVVGVGS